MKECNFLILDSDGCKFEMGVALDELGSVHWGNYMGSTGSAHECVVMVKDKEPTANGATYSNSGKHCFALFRAASRSSNCYYQTCIFSGTLL